MQYLYPWQRRTVLLPVLREHTNDGQRPDRTIALTGEKGVAVCMWLWEADDHPRMVVGERRRRVLFRLEQVPSGVAGGKPARILIRRYRCGGVLNVSLGCEDSGQPGCLLPESG